MTSPTEPTCKELLKKVFDGKPDEKLSVMMAWYEVLDLGHRFGVSTVRNSLNKLADDGYLLKERKDGRSYTYYRKA